MFEVDYMKTHQRKLDFIITQMVRSVEDGVADQSDLSVQILELQNRINKKDSRGDHEGQNDNFLHFFELVACCARVHGINLYQEVIWKYPGVCSYCVKPICECKDLLIRPDKQPDKIMNPFRMRAMKWSTQKWVEGNHLLYPCDSGDLKGLSKLWRHFLSEGGEFASALLKKSRGEPHNLGEELADLFEKAVNLCGPLQIPILDLWNEHYS